MITKYYRLDFESSEARKSSRLMFRDWVDAMNLGSIGHGMGALNIEQGKNWYFGFTPEPRFHPGVVRERTGSQLIETMEAGLRGLGYLARREFDLAEALKNHDAYDNTQDTDICKKASVVFYAIKKPETAPEDSPHLNRPEDILSEVRRVASSRSAGRIAEGRRNLQIAANNMLYISCSLDRSYRSDNLDIIATNPKNLPKQEQDRFLTQVLVRRQILLDITESALSELPYSWARFDLESLLQRETSADKPKLAAAQANYTFVPHQLQ